MQSVSSNISTAIQEAAQTVRPKVVATWADSRLMDGATASSSGAFHSFYGAEQASNGREYVSFHYAVTDTLNEYGDVITANGNYYACDDEDNGEDEFGWWSSTTSDATGAFATPPYVQVEFNTRKANYITVTFPRRYGQAKSITVQRKTTSDTWTTVGTYQTTEGDLDYEINLGSVLDIKGIKVTVNSTWNASDHARIAEMIPSYREDISDYIIDFSVEKIRENTDSTVPVGSTAANSCSMTLDNTSKKFNEDGAGALAAYIRKDVKMDVSYDIEVSEGVYESVSAGVFYVDSWNLSSDNMTISADCRDESKFLQDYQIENGVLFNDFTAGQAVADIARLGKIADQKINYIKRYSDNVVENGATGYWKCDDRGAGLTNWQARWWKKKYNNYFIIDKTITPDLEENASTINYLNKSVGGQADYLNAVFVGYITPTATGTHTFWFTSDDGVRIWIDGVQKLNAWYPQDEVEHTFTHSMTAGTLYRFEIHHYEKHGDQLAKFEWQIPAGTRAVVPSTAVAYYPQMVDFGGYANGPIVGPITGRTGAIVGDKKNYSLEFDGTNDYVQIGHHASLSDNNGAWTMHAWIYPDNTTGTKTIFHKGTGTSKYGLELSGSTVVSYLPLSGASVSRSAGTVTVSQWNEIIVTWDGTTRYHWVNGVLANQFADSGTFQPDSTNPLYIGAENRTLTPFDGKIDEVAVYPLPLTATQCRNSYAFAKAKTIPTFAHLYANDDTAWDSMAEIATADLGTFNFNESGNFYYTNGNYLYETDISGSIASGDNESFMREVLRTKTSQYTLDDATNIISAEKVIEQQVNKAIVKVNPLTSTKSGLQGIWRAEDNASLVTTTLNSSPTASSTSLTVSNTDSPLWPDSGYFKIDNEIISYNAKGSDSFSGLERGLFGTTAASHTSGALVREVRVFEIEYSNAPVVRVSYPFITAKIREKTVDIDLWQYTNFTAKLVVSAASSNATGQVILLEGENPSTDLRYATSIAGVPIVEQSSNQKITEKAASLNDNIRKWGLKVLEIDNRFIQTTEIAQRVADILIGHYSDPSPVLSVETMGIPQLQLGDRVTISSLDQLDITSKEYWVLEISMSYDGGISQSMVLREVN